MSFHEQLKEPVWQGCFCHVLRSAAAKIATACLKGSGEVRPLEDTEDPEIRRVGTGLYQTMMEAAEAYMGCRRRAGAAMCQKQEETGWPGIAWNRCSQDGDIPQK